MGDKTVKVFALATVHQSIWLGIIVTYTNKRACANIIFLKRELFILHSGWMKVNIGNLH